MKFMLMMNTPYGNGDYGILEWPAAALGAHIDFMKRINKDLREAGEYVAGEGLTPPGQARIVRAGKGGAPEITDGPFAETKEFLAGYWIVDVDSKERAYALAARISTAPGIDGKPLNMPVEVREVMSGPPPTE
jgi:hypothetical protein